MLAAVGQAHAHGVAAGDETFLAEAQGVHIVPYMYLGAKHMVTGYDHLLYLAGVIFFLREVRDVIRFVSLFTLGHSLTLLYGVLSGIHINVFLIDAIIGLSVCYKALENLGTIRILDPKLAVFGFGLFHGFGLATKLQDIALSEDGLVTNMIAFNVGVEIGQVLALVFLMLLFTWARSLNHFPGIARYANLFLFGAGLILFGMHSAGFLLS